MKTENRLSNLGKFMQPLLRAFAPAKTEVRYNPVMAKWDEHYARYPGAYGRHSTLRYLTPAD